YFLRRCFFGGGRRTAQTRRRTLFDGGEEMQSQSAKLAPGGGTFLGHYRSEIGRVCRLLRPAPGESSCRSGAEAGSGHAGPARISQSGSTRASCGLIGALLVPKRFKQLHAIVLRRCF